MAKPQKLPSGKWRVQIRKNGVYRNKSFSTRKAAVAWESEMVRQLDQISSSGYIHPTGMTLAHLIDLYLDSNVGRKSSQNKTYHIGKISEWLGHHLLVNLSPMVLRDFVDMREAAGVQGATIANELGYLRTVLKWGKDVRHIDTHPEYVSAARSALTSRGLSPTSAERDRVPSPAELERLYHYFRQSSTAIPMETIIRFALASAMRRGEIMRVTAEMMDIEKRTVTMRRKDPHRKDDNIQTIPIPAAAWEILLERRKLHPTGRLFPYDPQAVTNRFVDACRRLGIHDLRFHDLRHAATAALFRAGLDIPRVAMITGHRSWEHLKRYTNLDAADVHAVLDGGS
jgi:integrase